MVTTINVQRTASIVTSPGVTELSFTTNVQLPPVIG